MKTIRTTVIATTVALVACSAALATDGSRSKAAVQVAFSEPEKFTDFRKSEFFDERDAEDLQNELTSAIERTVRASLPPGFTLNLRFTDIDLAGEINPFQRMNMDHVRVYRGVYTPRLTFDYAVLDAQGGTVLKGSEKLTDLAYDMKMRAPRSDYTNIEADLMSDFIRGLRGKLAKGTS